MLKKWRKTRENSLTVSEVVNGQEVLSQVSIPTEQPIVTAIAQPQQFFFGRRKLTTSYSKEELTPEKIIEILPSIMREHQKNVDEIEYLYNYYKGIQPIINKFKKVRPDINNIVLENHAFEIVEFRKANGFGEPVQYVQKGEKDSEVVNPEIATLTKFVESEDKSSDDKELSEWQYICGTAYRYVDSDDKDDEDEAPFETSVPDPRKTFVVYSSDIKEKPMFAGYYTYFSDKIMSPDEREIINKYRIITIYTEGYILKIKDNFVNGHYNNLEVLPMQILGETSETYTLMIPGIRIIEYPLNSSRLGLVELIMSPLNAINKIKSDDLDAIDQFVQSLLVFVNQDVEVEDVKALEEAGALKIFSENPDKPADVKLLTAQLDHGQTKIVTDDLYNNALVVAGCPRLNDKASGGDTGQARLLGEGWTMAYQRAKQDDLSFIKSERQFLKLVLKICKNAGQLTNLKITDIDIKIPRDKADNLLVKAQSLLNLLQSGVHPEIAFTVVGLFGDPHDVYEKSVKFFGEDFWSKITDKNTSNVENNSTGDDKNIKTNADEGKGGHTNKTNKSVKTGV